MLSVAGPVAVVAMRSARSGQGVALFGSAAELIVMRRSQNRCRPRESRDPYSAAKIDRLRRMGPGPRSQARAPGTTVTTVRWHYLATRASGVFGEDRGDNRDVALQHAREAIAHFGRGCADRYRARDVGRAVLVLRAGVDEEEFVCTDAPVGLARDAIVHDCRVRPAAGD